MFSYIFGIIALVSQAIEIKHVKQKMLMFKSSMKHACKRACQSLASRASVESDSESVNLDRYVLSRTLRSCLVELWLWEKAAVGCELFG